MPPCLLMVICELRKHKGEVCNRPKKVYLSLVWSMCTLPRTTRGHHNTKWGRIGWVGGCIMPRSLLVVVAVLDQFWVNFCWGKRKTAFLKSIRGAASRATSCISSAFLAVWSARWFSGYALLPWYPDKTEYCQQC